MYKVLGTLALILAALTCSAQLTLPLSGGSPSDSNHKATRVTSRTLTGMVLDKDDQPIANAVVYLKNTKTLTVKTYIAQNDGTYRFPALSRDVDYDVYAERAGKKSGTKSLSQFDDRATANINLHIDTGK
jgi:hypothetical protein